MIYLTKHIFLRDWQISLETLGCNWWSEMRKLFSSIGKESLFSDMQTCNMDDMKNKEFWIQTVQTKPKLRKYVSFKIDLEVENYVCNNLPKNR